MTNDTFENIFDFKKIFKFSLGKTKLIKAND